MLSFNRTVLVLALMALSACGFQPVYAPGATGANVQNKISVQAPNNRNAFLLTQRLEERLGRASNADYTLQYAISTSQANLAVDTEGSVTRFNLVGSARFSIIATSTGQVALSDTVTNFTGYSAAGTTVATFAAERDARKRLMILLADQIVTRVLSTDLE